MLKRLLLAATLLLSGGSCLAQTVSYASAADVQAACLTISLDFNAGLQSWGKLNNDFQMCLNTYLSWVQGGQAAETQRFEVNEGRIKSLEQWRDGMAPKLTEIETASDQAATQAANALSLAQSIIDAHPCDILNFKAEPNELGVLTFSFTTPRPCTGWLSGGYIGTLPNLQTTHAACPTNGTITGAQDNTVKTSWSWAIPASWPAHGCVVVRTWDQYGNVTPKQFTY
jgi:hypothetical protein